MKKDRIVKLLNILHARNITPSEDWVRCSCLFAHHNHASKRDNNPSSGISIHPNKSIYHCYGCGVSLPIDAALFELFLLNKAEGIIDPSVVDARIFLDSESSEYYVYEEPDTLEPKKSFYDFTEGWLKGFSSAFSYEPALEYLRSRMGGPVPDQVIKDFDIRFDQARWMVGFPYRESKNNKVAGMRGRSIDVSVNTDETKKKFRHHDYPYAGHNNTSLIWYRANALDSSKPLIVVEGEFDAARVYQQYRNVTALLTAHASPEKMNYLCQFTKGIYWFSDSDDAGQKSRLRARKYFEEQGILFKDLFVPEDLQQEDGKKVKDPGATPAKYLKYILKEHMAVDDLII